jgi:hypothetical protein
MKSRYISLFDYDQFNHFWVNDNKAPLCSGQGVFGFEFSPAGQSGRQGLNEAPNTTGV